MLLIWEREKRSPENLWLASDLIISPMRAGKTEGKSVLLNFALVHDLFPARIAIDTYASS